MTFLDFAIHEHAFFPFSSSSSEECQEKEHWGVRRRMIRFHFICSSLPPFSKDNPDGFSSVPALTFLFALEIPNTPRIKERGAFSQAAPYLRRTKPNRMKKRNNKNKRIPPFPVTPFIGSSGDDGVDSISERMILLQMIRLHT
ncbi:hypothetical protein TNCT_588121 [Trichonephila clavata]|uniref:Uncharacterized protein n=1 Tax=Trichonephila clavata TaxID=2740835 RepID=A0A8X6LB36_TRICU|nr:hypothetical protein TNCT_588121 [Trichonephila clavata]